MSGNEIQKVNIQCIKVGEKMRKLVLSEEQREYLNDLWDGDELCSECDVETPFSDFNPMKTEYITCKHCGKKIHPCSLCDGRECCGVYETCQESLQAALLWYNARWNEKINGIYGR